MTTHSDEKAHPEGMFTEQEWGVRYGASEHIRSHGTGFWAMRHAEQEVKRVRHNASLPSVGQPRSAEVVQRTVTRYLRAEPWVTADTNTPTATTTDGDA